VKVRTEARRNAILEVAAQVFLEKGFEGASMSEIAQRVGGSRATLYGYFPSKEEVFLAVTNGQGEKHMRPAVSELAAHAPGELQQALTRFSAKLVSFLASDETCATERMVIAEAGRSEIGRLFYETGPKVGLSAFAQVLHDAMARGDLRQADPWVASQHLVALIQAEIVHRWYDPTVPVPAPEQAHQMAERAVEVFVRGYAP
jgi:AcrR family transcriptional regulator